MIFGKTSGFFFSLYPFDSLAVPFPPNALFVVFFFYFCLAIPAWVYMRSASIPLNALLFLTFVPLHFSLAVIQSIQETHKIFFFFFFLQNSLMRKKIML